MRIETVLVGKCPRCGGNLSFAKACLSDGSILIFIYCSDSRCRYAEEKIIRKI